MLTLVIVAVIGGGVLFWSLPYLGPVGRKLWFGEWEVDETGQPRRVLHRDHHGTLIDATEHHVRRDRAASARKLRRTDLLLAVIMFGGGAATLLYFWGHPAPFFAARPHTIAHAMSIIGTGIILFFAAIFCGCGLIFVFRNSTLEALHAQGFQHMEGAKVLDSMPRQPDGPAKVREENPYGGPAHPTPADVDPVFGGHTPDPGFRFKD